jgi:hypothetical protein
MDRQAKRQSMLEFIHTNASILVALASALISLCAFGLSTYMGYVTRRHTRVSVRPYLMRYLHKEPISSEGTAKVVWHLCNGGLGPAIITSYELFFENKLVNTSSEPECIRAANAIFGQIPTSFNFLNLQPGYLMRKDEERVILSAVLSTESVKRDKLDDYAFLNAIFDKLCVSVKYKSLYDEDFVLESEEASKYRLP